jgi:hypothetical protein
MSDVFKETGEGNFKETGEGNTTTTAQAVKAVPCISCRKTSHSGT